MRRPSSIVTSSIAILALLETSCFLNHWRLPEEIKLNGTKRNRIERVYPGVNQDITNVVIDNTQEPKQYGSNIGMDIKKDQSLISGIRYRANGPPQFTNQVIAQFRYKILCGAGDFCTLEMPRGIHELGIFPMEYSEYDKSIPFTELVLDENPVLLKVNSPNRTNFRITMYASGLAAILAFYSGAMFLNREKQGESSMTPEKWILLSGSVLAGIGSILLMYLNEQYKGSVDIHPLHPTE